MFCSAVFHGRRVGVLKDDADFKARLVDGRAVRENLPSLIVSSPAIIIRSVLFPQPLGPTRETNSPFSTEKVAELTASNAAAPLP